MADNKSALFEKINNDLKEAMKAKDELKLSVLRMMKSKVLNVNARGDLPEAEVVKIVSKYGKELKETIEEFTKLGRSVEVDKAKQELAIVQAYLPKELSPEEIKALEARMWKCAEDLEFEEAAVLRERIKKLRKLDLELRG